MFLLFVQKERITSF